jgi:hypothetical protein
MLLQMASSTLPRSIVKDKKGDPKEMKQNIQDEFKLL